MSKPAFSPQAAWDTLLKEERYLRRFVPRLRVIEIVIITLFVLGTWLSVITTNYALLAATEMEDSVIVVSRVPLLWELSQSIFQLSADPSNAATFAYLGSIGIVLILCLLVALLLRIFFLFLAKKVPEQSLPIDRLQALKAVVEKANQVSQMDYPETYPIRWACLVSGGGVILSVLLTFLVCDSQSPDFKTYLTSAIFLGLLHWVFSCLSFLIIRFTVLGRDWPNSGGSIAIIAGSAYKREKQEYDKKYAERKTADAIQRGRLLFHEGKFAEAHKILSTVRDSTSGDLLAMLTLTDGRLGKAEDGAQRSYKLLWDAKDLGFQDNRIRAAVDQALDQIKPLVMERSESDLLQAYQSFLRNKHGSVIYHCEPLAEFGHPDAIMLMLVSRVESRNNPKCYPEWLELAKKAQRRGFNSMFDEIFEELMDNLELAIRYNDLYEEERKNRLSQFSDLGHPSPITTWAEPSGWCDFRTGEPLYRANGKIVNANGEEVSVAWWS